MLQLNPNLKVFEKNEKQLLLKINNDLLRTSENEYQILKQYAINNNPEEVIAYFSNEINIKEDVLVSLVDRAVQNKILVKHPFRKHPSLMFFGAEINFSLRKNKKILELISLDLSYTLFDKLFSFSLVSKLILIFFISIFLFLGFDLLSSPLNFKENYFKTLYLIPFNFGSLVGYIYLASFCSVAFHEFGHFVMYKLLNGKASIFGFGLLLFIFPAFFTKIFPVLIEKKRDKILINLGGLLFDLFSVLFILFFTKHFHESHPTLSFFAYSLLISITIRSIFNVNIFLPGTDGYQILQDTLGVSNLYNTSFEKLKHLKKNNWNKVHLIYSLYFICSLISILISWGTFAIPFLLLFYYAI